MIWTKLKLLLDLIMGLFGKQIFEYIDIGLAKLEEKAAATSTWVDDIAVKTLKAAAVILKKLLLPSEVLAAAKSTWEKIKQILKEAFKLFGPQIFAFLDKGIKELREKAKTTETTLDDGAVEILASAVEVLKKWLLSESVKKPVDQLPEK